MNQPIRTYRNECHSGSGPIDIALPEASFDSRSALFHSAKIDGLIIQIDDLYR